MPNVRCHCPPGTDGCPNEPECYEAWQEGRLTLVRGGEEFEPAVKPFAGSVKVQRWAGADSPDSRGRLGAEDDE